MPLASVSLFFLPHSIVERLKENNYKDMIIDPATSSLAGVHPETEQHLSGGLSSQHGEVSSVEWNFLYSTMTSSDKQVASVSSLNHMHTHTHPQHTLLFPWFGERQVPRTQRFGGLSKAMQWVEMGIPRLNE